MVLSHLASIDFNLGDLLQKLSIVICKFLLLALGVLKKVLVSLALYICLIHFTLLCHPTMIDLTVKLVELVKIVQDLLSVFLLLAKVVIGLLELLICELFYLLRRHATLTRFSSTRHRS